MNRIHALSTIALAAALAGCSPTYAPPIRGAHYGAPGRLGAGQIELGGTAAIANSLVGGPNAGVGLGEGIALEAGGNFATGDKRNQWAMGYLGPRFSFVPGRDKPIHFAGDLELGVGAGVGGARCPSYDACDSDGHHWDNRLAYGGYQGLGLGVHFNWFALYLRGRIEESVAENIPVTYWPSAMLGTSFDLKRVVSIDLGGGLAGYKNKLDHEVGPFLQGGFTVRFDAFKPPARDQR